MDEWDGYLAHQELGLGPTLTVLLVGGGIVLGLLFWPFIVVQEYFLHEHAIDKFTLIPNVVGTFVELAYIGAAVMLLWMLFTSLDFIERRDAELHSTVENPRNGSVADGGSIENLSIGNIIGNILGRIAAGLGTFGLVCALILVIFWPSDRSAEERARMLHDRCTKEVTSSGAVIDSGERADRIKICVERKIDSM